MNDRKKPGKSRTPAFIAMDGVMQTQKGFLTNLFGRLSIETLGLNITKDTTRMPLIETAKRQGIPCVVLIQ